MLGTGAAPWLSDRDAAPAGLVVCDLEEGDPLPSWLDQLVRAGVGVGRTTRTEADAARALDRVWRSSVEHDQRRLRIVEALITSLAVGDPVEGIVRRLAELFDGAAVLYDRDGDVVHASGGAPINLIRQQIAGRSGDSAVGVGRWRFELHEVSIRTQHYTLAVGQRDRPQPDVHLQYALDVVSQLLRSFQSLDSFARLQQVHHSALLLTELERGVSPGREALLWERMREFGFLPFEPLWLLTGRLEGVDDRTHLGLTRVAEAVASSEGAVLIHESGADASRSPVFRILTQDVQVLERLLALDDHRCAIGVSEPFTQLSEAPTHIRAAEMARAAARRSMALGQRSGGCSAVRVEDMTPTDWLLARTASLRDDRRRTQFADPLRARPELLTTLLTSFGNSHDVARTAAELHVHPNTVRYRLKQVEDLMRISLSDPRDVTNLVLALHEDL